ncbi:MAG: hypothetical protein FWH57_08310 [Oscillospiraceae bacterium]|nr:hypothetical protein [Oscillospiraceae bacterium]
MSIFKYSASFITVLLLFQYACGINSNIHINNNEVNTNKQNMNLREIDKETNKINIDVLLDKINAYPNDCGMSDFKLRETYASFAVTDVNTYDEDDYKRIDAYFKLQTNKKKGNYDTTAEIAFYESQSFAQDVMRNSLFTYTAMEVYPSSLDIGDFAIGDAYRIKFIRGNVYVSVTGYDGVEIDVLAGEIDKQILEILNET